MSVHTEGLVRDDEVIYLHRFLSEKPRCLYRMRFRSSYKHGARPQVRSPVPSAKEMVKLVLFALISVKEGLL